MLPCRRGGRPASALELHASSLKRSANNDPALRASYPMYTVPMEVFLAISAVNPHEELLDAGMLVEFDESKGRALFVSHQWLSEAHPDPDSQQLKVLQDALTNLLSGHSRISTAVFTELLHGRVPVPSAADLKEQLLFVWYDFFSCPQGNSPDSTNNQRNAINSIPHYVAKSQYFIILTPAVRQSALL